MSNLLTAQELKDRISNNDNRCTASPYLLLLREKRTMIVDGDYGGEKRWVEQASGDYLTADTKEELIERIKSCYDPDDLEEFKESDHQIESFYEAEYEYTENVFLTDVGYREHLEQNGHNLRKHDTYGIHAFRNKEIKSLLNLVDENIELQTQIKEMQEVINKLGKMGEFYANEADLMEGYDLKDDLSMVDNGGFSCEVLGKLARETMSDEQVKQYYKGE